MANFYSPLPEVIRYNGKQYRLSTSFDNVLTMYDAVNGMDGAAQVEIMLHYLVDGKHEISEGLLKGIGLLLFGAQTKKVNKKAYDFTQDSELIYAAFMQAYKIDLVNEQGKLHWWKFQALLSGLPSNTRFSEVVNIRTMEVPAPTKCNAEERQRIIRLKADFALKQSAEEREQNLQDGWKKVLSALMQRVKNG